MLPLSVTIPVTDPLCISSDTSVLCLLPFPSNGIRQHIQPWKLLFSLNGIFHISVSSVNRYHLCLNLGESKCHEWAQDYHPVEHGRPWGHLHFRDRRKRESTRYRKETRKMGGRLETRMAQEEGRKEKLLQEESVAGWLKHPRIEDSGSMRPSRRERSLSFSSDY